MGKRSERSRERRKEGMVLELWMWDPHDTQNKATKEQTTYVEIMVKIPKYSKLQN